MRDARSTEMPVADSRYMARALRLARKGFYSTHPNPRVGCVIVKDREIIGEGFHYRAGEPHAEINALREAGSAARGSTAYVTLEPCCHTGRTPPCTKALIDAGVSRVVFGATDPNPQVAGRGAAELSDAGIEVQRRCLEQHAEKLNAGFNKRMVEGLPYVRVKVAMTVDGKVALASGDSKWITSPAARADVQRMRAQSGAIVTGVGTVIADDPALTVRDPRFDTGGRQPLRVIFDSALRVPAQAQIFDAPGETVVLACQLPAASQNELEAAGAHVEAIAHNGERVDVRASLKYLASREINDVMVEAGPQLVSAFLSADVVDELIIFMAPKLFGTPAIDAFVSEAPASMGEVSNFKLDDVRRVGPDLRICLTPGAST